MKNAYNEKIKHYIKGDREDCLSCAVVAAMKCIARMRNLGRLGSVRSVDNGMTCLAILLPRQLGKWFQNMSPV